MKLYSTVFARVSFIVTMTLVLNACSAEYPFIPSTENSHNTVIVAATEAPQSEEDDNTRTAIDPTEYASGQIGVNWLPSDKIGVFGNMGSKNVPFDNQSSTESDKTTFSGILKEGEEPVYAYYPYPAAESSTIQCLKGTLPVTQHYSTSTRTLEGDWKVGTLQAGETTRFSFKHIFAFLKFDINAAGTPIAGETLKSVSLKIAGVQLGSDFSYDMTTGTCVFTPTPDADCVTMEWTDTPILTESTIHGYMSVAPVKGLAGKTIDIVITTNRHTVSFSRTATVEAFEANTYYTVPLELSKFADEWTIENNVREENAAWVPGLSSRLACANTVFAIPGQPFMHKIRVPEKPSQSAHAVVPVKTGIKRVWNLPEGLSWNAERCLVEGIAPSEGKYTYSVEFEIDGVTYQEGIHLNVSNNLHQPTPHMGWQSWNVLETKIDAESLKSVADALVDNGWANAGYKWLGIDDCWQMTDGSRDVNGVPMVNPDKFPGNGLKDVTDYIHSKGLKAGIYSDAGTLTCASGTQGGGILLGAYGHEDVIAQAFTDWGFDKLKEDWFWSDHGDNNGALDADSYSLAHELYGKMGSGIKAAGNKLLLSMCEWGTHDPWKWAAEVGSSSWRMSYDHRDGWMGQNGTTGTVIKYPVANSPTVNKNGIGLRNTIDLMRNLWSYTGINRFNDADMLVVGIRGGGTSSNDLIYSSKGTMGDAEYETEFAMWCMWSSPLLLTLDIRKSDINSHDVALLKNEELIAINQDPMGQGAEFVKNENDVDYYMKDLSNGDVAIAVVNLGDSQANYTVSLSDYEALDGKNTYTARNLISKTGAGTLSASSSLTGTLASHGTFIIRLAKE